MSRVSVNFIIIAQSIWHHLKCNNVPGAHWNGNQFYKNLMCTKIINEKTTQSFENNRGFGLGEFKKNELEFIMNKYQSYAVSLNKIS